MPAMSDIREALAANLAVLSGVQVSAYELDNPTPPTLHIFPADIQYDLAMNRGLDQWTLTVQGFVGAVSDIGAQQRLGVWLDSSGASSVKQAAQSDPTLGGLVADTTVTDVTYRRFSLSDGRLLVGADWTVQILGSGT